MILSVFLGCILMASSEQKSSKNIKGIPYTISVPNKLGLPVSTNKNLKLTGGFFIFNTNVYFSF